MHGNVIFNKHCYKTSCEFYNQTRFDKFISQSRNSTLPFLLPISSSSGRPWRICQRQHGIIEDGVQSPIQPERSQRNLQCPHDDADLASNFNFN